MTRFTPVRPRRRPDGSIDTGAHLAVGRRLRAEAARDLLAPRRARPVRPWRLIRPAGA